MVLEMVKSILEKFDPNADHARYTAVYSYASCYVDKCFHYRIHQPVCQACYNLIEVYLLGQSRSVTI